MSHHVTELKNITKIVICENPECKKEFVEKFYSSAKHCPVCRKLFIKTKIVKCFYCESEMEIRFNLSNKQICSTCKSEGKSLPKKSKKIKCIYCKKEFESYYNARVDTPCSDCKEKGHRSVIAQETGKQGTEKFKEMHNGKAPSQIKEIRDKQSKTLTEKFQDEEYRKDVVQKRKDTYKKRTGYDHQMYNLEVKEKIDNTIMERYGVKRVLQSDEFKQKVKETNLEKYGVEYGLQCPEIREKGKETCIKKYGEDHWAKTVEGKKLMRKIGIEQYEEERLKKDEKLKDMKIEFADDLYINAQSIYNWKCIECNTEFKTNFCRINHGYLCPSCYPRTPGTSIGEQELFKFVSNLLLNEEIINNDRTMIKPLELDVYIPNKKIAFEYNGIWFHSEESGIDKNYHINKTNLCKKKGIKLIHIFEDEWTFKRLIVEERIKHILNIPNSKPRIFARKCEIKEIDYKTKNEFLNKFHIQGSDKSIIKLGAFFEDELISVMTFSKGNISKGSKYIEGRWELNRFCSNYNYSIVGMAGKLFSHFKKNYNWNEIFSYADLRWSDGNVYFKLGFALTHITRPNYWYVKNSKRIHRFSLRKRHNEPKHITERILRAIEGYSTIWDCGNLKFSVKNKNNLSLDLMRTNI